MKKTAHAAQTYYEAWQNQIEVCNSRFDEIADLCAQLKTVEDARDRLRAAAEDVIKEYQAREIRDRMCDTNLPLYIARMKSILINPNVRDGDDKKAAEYESGDCWPDGWPVAALQEIESRDDENDDLRARLKAAEEEIREGGCLCTEHRDIVGIGVCAGCYYESAMGNLARKLTEAEEDRDRALAALRARSRERDRLRAALKEADDEDAPAAD